ncbi:MAG: MFS transporter [Gemmataceae bacterium]
MRFVVLIVTAFVAFNMYLDRACISQVKEQAGRDLNLDQFDFDWIFSAFFWTYALAQVPAAAISKRLGLRFTLAACCTLWSVFTIVTGAANSFVTILCARFFVGLFEAAAYPSASAVIRNWFPVEKRGLANAVVTFGGRSGFVLAMFATPFLMGQLGSWRIVLVRYGLLGIVAAVIFWLIVRDRPKQATLTEPAQVPDSKSTPLMALLRSPMVWIASVHQFGVNFGWVFLQTGMPHFFTDRFGIPENERGWVTSVPVFVGCFGMILGGVLIDWLTKHFGLKASRVIPLSGWLFIAAVAYMSTAFAFSPWLAVACLGIMAFAIDAANPAYWAFSQDIGKEHAAASLGFGNMIGNFGAALSPKILGFVSVQYGWTAMFIAGGLAFLLSAIVGLFLDPRKTIAFESPKPNVAS